LKNKYYHITKYGNIIKCNKIQTLRVLSQVMQGLKGGFDRFGNAATATFFVAGATFWDTMEFAASLGGLWRNRTSEWMKDVGNYGWDYTKISVYRVADFILSDKFNASIKEDLYKKHGLTSDDGLGSDAIFNSFIRSGKQKEFNSFILNYLSIGTGYTGYYNKFAFEVVATGSLGSFGGATRIANTLGESFKVLNNPLVKYSLRYL